MDEILGEYGTLIVETVAAATLLFFLQQLLLPSFLIWVDTFINLIV